MFGLRRASNRQCLSLISGGSARSPKIGPPGIRNFRLSPQWLVDNGTGIMQGNRHLWQKYMGRDRRLIATDFFRFQAVSTRQNVIKAKI